VQQGGNKMKWGSISPKHLLIHINSYGQHYSAKCNFCKKHWGRAYVQSLQAHECTESPDVIRNFYLEVLSMEKFAEDAMSIGSRIQQVL